MFSANRVSGRYTAHIPSQQVMSGASLTRTCRESVGIQPPLPGATFMDQPSRLPVILLVEPDDDNREMYVEYVTVCGFTPVAVAGGEEAVRRAWQAEAIVTALRLPGSCDGIELIQRLRHDEVTKATPIIVLTACVLGADRE